MRLCADCFARIGDEENGKFVTFGVGARGNNFAGKPRPMESENHRRAPSWGIQFGLSKIHRGTRSMCVRIRACVCSLTHDGKRQAVNERITALSL